MSTSIFKARKTVFALIVLLSAIATAAFAQQPQPATDQTEVIRISTELVQTGVLVLDKQGRFVEGLKPEQFELRVDGKPVTPIFFEHVIAGTANEKRLEAAAARGAAPASTDPASMATSYRGRTIIFFIDDLHLSAASVLQTRQAILEFVENQMGPDDLVAIASPSGQIGFLQRFTDVKAVLRAAIARLVYKSYAARDVENASMTEYTALKIEQGDKDALSYFAEELLKANNFRSAGGPLGPTSPSPFGGKSSSQPNSSGMSREMAERQVKERANILLKQSAHVTVNTLATLESLMRYSSELGGRKLVFFISDGFYLNDRNTGFSDKLKQIADAAVRAGVVIYTMDARGIVGATDASSKTADLQGRLSRANIGELAASQDALTSLASDTGGRALLNSGALTTAVNNALTETANYYLLAWRPPAEEQKGGNFKRLEVSIVGRPELTVRSPRGFLPSAPRSAVKESEVKAPAPETAIPADSAAKGTGTALMSALGALATREGLPTKLSTSFLDVPGSGLVLTASIQMATEVLGYGPDNKQAAAIDVAGVVFNDLGKQVGGFKTQLNVSPASQAEPGVAASVIHSYRVPLKPGIYQVRVAAQDVKSGRVGSAAQWIEIPDLATKRLTLSSLLIGGQFIGANQKAVGGGDSDQLQFSVDRRYRVGARLNFLTLVYNAAAGGNNGAPDLEAQIKIYRDGKAVITSPMLKVATDATTEPARVPYGANVALQSLPAGRYLLHVTISDKLAKTSASQQIGFTIE